jgi:hypothetical protein
MYIYIFTGTLVYVYVGMYIYIYTSIYVYIYMYICYVYIYMYVLTAPSPGGSTAGGGGLTREIAESLSKKLNATEMKAIINMDDLLKKNTVKLEYANDDNENLSSKLEGR